MLESVNLTAYVVLGFAMSYLALEGGWHLQPVAFHMRAKPSLLKLVR